VNLARLIRPHEAGKNDPDNALFDRNDVADLELRFIRSPCDGSRWRFVHVFILAEAETLCDR
jgi:hypothetical protein